MPHISIKHFPVAFGEGARAELAREITDLICRRFGTPEAAVSIALQAVAPDDWTAQVYRPEIAGRDQPYLIKEPGY